MCVNKSDQKSNRSSKKNFEKMAKIYWFCKENVTIQYVLCAVIDFKT